VEGQAKQPIRKILGVAEVVGPRIGGEGGMPVQWRPVPPPRLDAVFRKKPLAAIVDSGMKSHAEIGRGARLRRQADSRLKLGSGQRRGIGRVQRLTSGLPVRPMPERRQAHRRVVFAQLCIGAGAPHLATFKTEIRRCPDPVGEIGIVCRDEAAFTDREGFGGVQAEHGCGGRTNRLMIGCRGRIDKHRHASLGGEGVPGCGVVQVPVQRHRDNRSDGRLANGSAGKFVT